MKYFLVVASCILATCLIADAQQCRCGELCDCLDKVVNQCISSIFGEYEFTAAEEAAFVVEMDKFDKCMMGRGIQYDCTKTTGAQCNARRRKRNVIPMNRSKRQVDYEQQMEDCIFKVDTGIPKCYNDQAGCGLPWKANKRAFEAKFMAAAMACEKQ